MSLTSQPNYQPAPKLPQKFVVEFEEFKTLTVKERLQILFGYNLRIASKCIVDRKNTSVKAGSTVWLTKHVTPQGQMREHATEQTE